PGAICLWARARDGAVGGLQGQTELIWEAAGDLRVPVTDEQAADGLTWDVRLALALHEATADPMAGGPFWAHYRRFLPLPHTVTVPLCFPPALLRELHNDDMAGRAEQQQQRLRRLFPLLTSSLLVHPATAFYATAAKAAAAAAANAATARAAAAAAAAAATAARAAAMPTALQWAFALVRSRAFAAGAASGFEEFAFVPFLDQANHSPRPAADFGYDAAADEWRLTTLAPLPAGAEATISYGKSLDNNRLMTQYGFVLPGNPVAAVLSGFESPPARPPLVASSSGAAGATVANAASGERDGGVGDLRNELFARAQEFIASAGGGGSGRGADQQQYEQLARRAVPLIPVLAAQIAALAAELDPAPAAADGGWDDPAAAAAAVYVAALDAAATAAPAATSAEEDEALLEGDEAAWASSGAPDAWRMDARHAAALRYRLDRKRNTWLAAGMLCQFVAGRRRAAASDSSAPSAAAEAAPPSAVSG
ncbi:unnamed protein product, partial [Phaeothamnion confervicola]